MPDPREDGDPGVVNVFAFDSTGGAWLDAVRQELQRSEAVPVDGGKQVVGVYSLSMNTLGHAEANGSAVRQQIVEHRDDGRADVVILAQRRGPRDGQRVLPGKP
jgi:hypothetical protein